MIAQKHRIPEARSGPTIKPAARQDPGHTFYQRVRDAVGRIPRGTVATYGQIARLAGNPRAARMVGWALAGVPSGMAVPWQRVINAQGRISPRGSTDHPKRQQRLLEQEGVRFSLNGVVDLRRFQWQPSTTDD